MYPGAIPSYVGFTSSHTLAADNHAAQSNAGQADIIAIATKVGTGASTPASGLLLRGNGAGTSAWAQAALTSDVSGVLPQANGGTGTTQATGTGKAVYDTSPTISAPTLTTPTIASFASANHDHSNSAGGGQLNGANAITDGTITPAELVSGTGSSWAWQAWVPAVVGFSSTTVAKYFYTQIGKTVHFAIEVSGTSNSTSFTITLPVTSASNMGNIDFSIPLAQDNGVTLTSGPRAEIATATSTTVLILLTTYSGAGWTASGTKLVRFNGTYEAL